MYEEKTPVKKELIVLKGTSYPLWASAGEEMSAKSRLVSFSHLQIEGSENHFVVGSSEHSENPRSDSGFWVLSYAAGVPTGF